MRLSPKPTWRRSSAIVPEASGRTREEITTYGWDCRDRLREVRLCTLGEARRIGAGRFIKPVDDKFFPARVYATVDIDDVGVVHRRRRREAVGLEEAGGYTEAEALARAAVGRNPKDVWGIHAVGHVLEMQGRDAEGIAWYEEREGDWGTDCYFAVHNAWHLTLYHVDRDDPTAALAVYDRLLRPGRRSIMLNLCDAAY